MTGRKTERSVGHPLAAAAAVGLIAACTPASPPPARSTSTIEVPEAEAAEPPRADPVPEDPEGPEVVVSEPNCCKGLNDCKGRGGCAVAGHHDCMGKNECAGRGGCNGQCPGRGGPVWAEPPPPVPFTGPNRACCRGLNACKGTGGCKVAGSHDCAGKNPCKGMGGCRAHCPR